MPQLLRVILTVMSGLVLVSCAGTKELQLAPITGGNPTDVNLAGRWELRDDGDAARQVRQAEQEAAGRVSDAIAPSKRNNSRKAKDSASVHVFLETGRRLKITQTVDGLFVSFDRSVVEEYRFRERRFISVGPIEAERASGWEDDRYVIMTLDEQGALLTETYRLVEADVLERTMQIVYREKEQLSARQLFDRAD